MKKIFVLLFLLTGCSTTTQVPVQEGRVMIHGISVHSTSVIPEISDRSSPEFGSSSDAFVSQFPECFYEPYRGWTPQEADLCYPKLMSARVKSHGIEMAYQDYLKK